MTSNDVKGRLFEGELRFDWSEESLNEGERVEDDLGWTIHPVFGRDDDLQIIWQETDETSTRAEYSGGISGVTYTVSSTIRSTDGRILCRFAELRLSNQDERSAA